MAIDISGLNASQLEALEVRARARLLVVARERKAQLRQRIEELLRREGITLSEILPRRGLKARNSKGKLPAKFQHPQDASLRWSGHARRPRWFKDALAKGITEAQMAAAASGRTPRAAAVQARASVPVKAKRGAKARRGKS